MTPTHTMPDVGAMNMNDDDVLRLAAQALGNPLLFEDLKQDFTVHTEAGDWIKFAALLSASKPAVALHDSQIETFATDARQHEAMEFSGSTKVASHDNVVWAIRRALTAASFAAPTAQAAVPQDERGAAKLDKPAQVAGAIFRPGVSWTTVIGAAQRQYEYRHDTSVPKSFPDRYNIREIDALKVFGVDQSHRQFVDYCDYAALQRELADVRAVSISANVAAAAPAQSESK